MMEDNKLTARIWGNSIRNLSDSKDALALVKWMLIEADCKPVTIEDIASQMGKGRDWIINNIAIIKNNAPHLIVICNDFDSKMSYKIPEEFKKFGKVFQ